MLADRSFIYGNPGSKDARNWLVAQDCTSLPLEKRGLDSGIVQTMYSCVIPDWLDVVEMKFRYPFSCIITASH